MTKEEIVDIIKSNVELDLLELRQKRYERKDRNSFNYYRKNVLLF